MAEGAPLAGHPLASRPAPRPTPAEWAGWALLALLTLGIAYLAIFRPTDPDAILNEIRLAAGFDRYQAAMNEGDRLYARATADFRLSEAGEGADLSVEYRMLAEAAENYALARREAEGFGEDQRAQIRLFEVYYAWSKALFERGTGKWYERNDEATLGRARDLADRGLALPQITGEQRERMEDLATKIDRALRWPIL
ncbi:MAG TPA: hypothetical protein VM737_09930 [Gemmatimonadota bacterium]|nr:hypothetical protein [Gemmatimonadota bacterium]